MGGKNKQPLGYTVVEVMIVLAVTGTMFLIAAAFVNGKEESTAFNTAIHQMGTNLQTIIEQVTDGQFSDIPLSCHRSSKGLTISGGSDLQGTNSDCTFLGKVVHFMGKSNYEVFTLAGSRLDSTGNPATETIPLTPNQLNSQNPTAIYNNPNNLDSSPPVDLTVQDVIPQNLTVDSIAITDSDGGPLVYSSMAFGFVQNLINSPPVSLVYVPNVTASQNSEGTAAPKINSNLRFASAVSICLTDGTRRALVSVGDSGTASSPLSVNVQNLGITNSCT